MKDQLRIFARADLGAGRAHRMPVGADPSRWGVAVKDAAAELGVHVEFDVDEKGLYVRQQVSEGIGRAR